MIIVGDYVIVTPPKTGSTTMRTVMRPWADVMLQCKQFENDLGHHCTPAMYKQKFGVSIANKKLLVVVRNPADRLRSLYRHYCHYVKEVTLTWDEFITKHRSPGFHWFFRMTVPEILVYCEIYGVIRTEFLCEDLHKWLGTPLDLDIPRLHQIPLEGSDELVVPESWILNDVIPYDENLKYVHI